MPNSSNTQLRSTVASPNSTSSTLLGGHPKAAAMVSWMVSVGRTVSSFSPVSVMSVIVKGASEETGVSASLPWT
jgi:hypothetical protein